jgi:uncharacterized protein (UPF0332 family)
LTELDNCFERKLLTGTDPSAGLAKKSLKQAALFLMDAEDMVKIENERMGTIALYNAFFHVARTLLFKDGIKERSHFCIARYIEEKYVNKKLLNKDFLDYLDTLRDARHETQYSLAIPASEIDLSAGIKICREFMIALDALIR